MTKPVLDSSPEVMEIDIEAALDPVEVDGVYRDTIRCAPLASMAGAVLLSPPAPRPKKKK
ncbi:hypothetical protein [Pseudonocardia spinosispora]|uniref:hypothetical protein n=1 Tax=Pseudonocardia spinosispora TaxID=103441 RepID=UPI000413534F|nr:hypothetical protein [Pseudonocardia spinosispora]